jgi:homogentisate 1,2-dioxygenase
MNDAFSEPRDLAALPALLRSAGSRKLLIVTGPSARHVERLRALLVDFEVELFSGARRHVPVEVLAEARSVLLRTGADTLLALGGGSAIGLAKALVLEHELKFFALPTTYSGSERTSLFGTTENGTKTTGRNPRVKPLAVINDASLTREMPKALTVASLFNALSHPLSALGAGASGELRDQALHAIELVYGAIEALLQSPTDPSARARATRGAALAAEVLENSKLGEHHQLAHHLGGAFDLEHGALHAVLLPHSVHALRGGPTEAVAAVEAVERRLRVLDWEAKLFEMLQRSGAGTSLKALGVSLARLQSLLGSHPELPRDRLRAAFHGRKPSRHVRLEDWGLSEAVARRGPELEEARRIVVAVHGRGVTAESVVDRVLEISGHDPTLAIVAPQAPDHAWYQARYSSPRAEIGDALEAALVDVGGVLDRVLRASKPERVVLFGFSQGACLALELFARRNQRLAAVIALSGAGIGPRGEEQPLESGIAATPVLLGSSTGDAHLGTGDVAHIAERLRAAGCQVTLEMVPGEQHALHPSQRLIAREWLRGEPATEGPRGFRNEHASEALPGAIPEAQNTPRKARYGLYPELISGTGFTAAPGENFRTWLHRIRPAAQQGHLQPVAHATFGAAFASEPPEVNLTGFAPLPLPSAPTDFIDGLFTLGGAGSARSRRGYAVHLYAANRSMEDRAFYDADGELLVLPELGALRVFTELGVLDVNPGELLLVPRGLRISVQLREAFARGYVAEVFGRHFHLPDRGPLGSNGLADARHFRAPAAWHEDRLAVGYRITAKIGDALYEARQDYSPFDVAAWHGNHAAYVYDLARFTPAGYTCFDHPDPSIHTVLTAPLDERGSNSLDLVVFPARWDNTEHTFRPPYFHRNATTEINGIIRAPVHEGSRFVPGCLFITPSMTPHGVVAADVERAFAMDDATADRPHRYLESACWFQFETALPISLTPWAREAAHRHRDWNAFWGVYRSHFDPTRHDR